MKNFLKELEANNRICAKQPMDKKEAECSFKQFPSGSLRSFPRSARREKKEETNKGGY
jgi:hypothetical protein